MLDPKYVAGFLDAEGYILLNNSKYIQMGFVNTKSNIIYQLKEKYGGTINIEKHDNPNHSTTYRLQIFGKFSVNCLQDIKDHLFIKKESAELALKFDRKHDNLQEFKEKIYRSRENIQKQSDLSLEYIAGFFEGEGHIGIWKRYRNNRASPLYQLGIAMTNTHFGILKSIQNKTGGYIVKRPSSGNRQTTWDLKLRASLGMNFLLKIFPLLIVKKEQAQIAIDFQTKQNQNNSRVALSKEDLEFKENCKNRLMLLHKTDPQESDTP